MKAGMNNYLNKSTEDIICCILNMFSRILILVATYSQCNHYTLVQSPEFGISALIGNQRYALFKEVTLVSMIEMTVFISS